MVGSVAAVLCDEFYYSASDDNAIGEVSHFLSLLRLADPESDRRRNLRVLLHGFHDVADIGLYLAANSGNAH